jgi:hypothetical protein
MLATTCAVACWFGVLRIAPGIGILLSGIFLALFSVVLIIRLRRRHPSRRSRVAVYLFATAAWFYLYVLSIGPVIALDNTVFHLDKDVIEIIYAPVIWLHGATPLREPLEKYVELWDWP